MKRLQNKGVGVKPLPDPKNEPDFYTMKPVPINPNKAVADISVEFSSLKGLLGKVNASDLTAVGAKCGDEKAIGTSAENDNMQTEGSHFSPVSMISPHDAVLGPVETSLTSQARFQYQKCPSHAHINSAADVALLSARQKQTMTPEQMSLPISMMPGLLAPVISMSATPAFQPVLTKAEALAQTVRNQEAIHTCTPFLKQNGQIDLQPRQDINEEVSQQPVSQQMQDIVKNKQFSPT